MRNETWNGFAHAYNLQYCVSPSSDCENHWLGMLMVWFANTDVFSCRLSVSPAGKDFGSLN